MNVAAFQAELEADLSWRVNELRQIANLALSADTITEGNLRRRPLVVFLYAHFEGFVKLALSCYANHVNNENLRCHEVKTVLAATAMSDVFAALQRVNSSPQRSASCCLAPSAWVTVIRSSAGSGGGLAPALSRAGAGGAPALSSGGGPRKRGGPRAAAPPPPRPARTPTILSTPHPSPPPQPVCAADFFFKKKD